MLRLSHNKVFIEKNNEYIVATQYNAFDEFLKKYRENKLNKLEGRVGTVESVIEKISQVSMRLWLYSVMRPVDGRQYIFCKVLSPDFYLISNWQQRNINHPFEKFANAYSNKINETCPVFV
jgi:hypothetical protein